MPDLTDRGLISEGPEEPASYHPQRCGRPEPDLFPPRANPDLDHRYTLDEARAILRREECERGGHYLTDIIARNAVGTVTRHHITCDRCGATFRETTTP